MEVKTIIGVILKTPTGFEYGLVIALALFVLVLFIIAKYLQTIKTKKVHESQMLLFKAKQLGLTNFQFKVLRGITEMLNTAKPYEIMHKPDLFEKSITSFLNFMNNYQMKDVEHHSSLLDISRDIVITYEKIYNHSETQKPLSAFSDIVQDKLVYFLTASKDVFIGKLTRDIDRNLMINVFIGRKKIAPEITDNEIEVHMWRSGDAEYTFNVNVQRLDENVIYISEPEELNRKNAVRTPFVDVIIPCEIHFKSEDKSEPAKKLPTTIFKLNEHEFVIRTKHKLNFSSDYKVDFTLNDFNIASDAKIIADRTISQENIYYYTYKFQNLSDAAKGIILKYITDRL